MNDQNGTKDKLEATFNAANATYEKLNLLDGRIAGYHRAVGDSMFRIESFIAQANAHFTQLDNAVAANTRDIAELKRARIPWVDRLLYGGILLAALVVIYLLATGQVRVGGG